MPLAMFGPQMGHQQGGTLVSGCKFIRKFPGPLCLWQSFVLRWDLDKVGLFRSLQPSDSEGQRIVVTAIRCENLAVLYFLNTNEILYLNMEDSPLFKESFQTTFIAIFMICSENPQFSFDCFPVCIVRSSRKWLP